MILLPNVKYLDNIYNVTIIEYIPYSEDCLIEDPKFEFIRHKNSTIIIDYTNTAPSLYPSL